MIKGFIEVHNADDKNNAVLVNINHITEVRKNIIYMDDALAGSADYSHINCTEDYLDIAKKIKEATAEGNANNG
jgi:hypothetical protein